MKITCIIGSLQCGGAERVVSTLANYWSKVGIDVTIITFTKQTSFYPLKHRVKFVPLGLERKLKFTGISFIHRISNFWRLRIAIKQTEPDILISFGTIANIIILFNSWLLRVPVIVSEHTNYLRGKKIVRLLRRFLYSFAQDVVLLTEYDRIYYDKFLTNITVIQNPLSFEPVIVTNRCREKILLAVGRMHPVKGFDTLIKIFSRLSKEYPNWKLRIVGNGESYDELKSLVNYFGIQDKVEFPGRLKDIKSEFRRAEIFVLSSRMEGFPMTLVEAMSQGCACIAYDCITGPSEIISSGQDGLLIDNQSMSQMEQGLIKLMENLDLRKELAQNSVRNIQRYSVENISKIWFKLFDKICV